MRSVREIVIAVVLAVGTMLTVAAPASLALPSLVGESVIGSSGSGAGQMNGPMDVAVDSSGIFVSDRYNNRVDVFNTGSGAFVRSFGSMGSGPGQFDSVAGIAVGPGGDGGLYVVDVNNHRVQVFDPLGNVYSTFGTAGQAAGEFYGLDDVAYDSSLRRVYTVESGMSRVQQWADGRPPTYMSMWGSFGTSAGQFESARGIGVGDGGTVYVSDDNGQVSWFSSSGAYGGSFGTNGSGPGQFQIPRGIAFTPGGNILVVDSLNDRIQEWTNTGQFVRSFGDKSGLSEPQGIAVYGTSSPYDVYVTDFQNDRIVKYAFGTRSTGLSTLRSSISKEACQSLRGSLGRAGFKRTFGSLSACASKVRSAAGRLASDAAALCADRADGCAAEAPAVFGEAVPAAVKATLEDTVCSDLRRAMGARTFGRWVGRRCAARAARAVRLISSAAPAWTAGARVRAAGVMVDHLATDPALQDPISAQDAAAILPWADLVVAKWAVLMESRSAAADRTVGRAALPGALRVTTTMLGLTMKPAAADACLAGAGGLVNAPASITTFGGVAQCTKQVQAAVTPAIRAKADQTAQAILKAQQAAQVMAQAIAQKLQLAKLFHQMMRNIISNFPNH